MWEQCAVGRDTESERNRVSAILDDASFSEEIHLKKNSRKYREGAILKLTYNFRQKFLKYLESEVSSPEIK